MITEPVHTEPINLRILSEGLFQPVLHLNLTRDLSGKLSGTAVITVKELNDPLNLSFVVVGSYQNELHDNNLTVQLKGYKLMDDEKNACLFLNLEMNQEWTTGICNYQHLHEHSKPVRNATVSSILFAKPPSKKPFSISDLTSKNHYALL